MEIPYHRESLSTENCIILWPIMEAVLQNVQMNLCGQKSEETAMQESRLFKIVYYLLDKGRATAPELAEKFEVSVRTIYRDISSSPLKYRETQVPACGIMYIRFPWSEPRSMDNRAVRVFRCRCPAPAVRSPLRISLRFR